MSIYFGPYVECKVHKVDSFVIQNTCSNKECKNYCRDTRSIKFCPLCGFACEERQIPKKVDNVDKWEMHRLLKERLTTLSLNHLHFLENETSHLWISNIIHSLKRSLHIEHNINSILSVDSTTIEDELSEFVNFFIKEIDVLYEKYGEENTKVKYGLIVDAYE